MNLFTAYLLGVLTILIPIVVFYLLTLFSPSLAQFWRNLFCSN